MSDDHPSMSGTVAAGFPIPAECNNQGPLDLNALLVHNKTATFFVRVSGDSMIGRGIFDGDILVVDRSLTPANNDVIIAAVNGEFTVKTLRIKYVNGEKRYSLEPANPDFPAITISRGDELDYFGKVIASIHRH